MRLNGDPRWTSSPHGRYSISKHASFDEKIEQIPRRRDILPRPLLPRGGAPATVPSLAQVSDDEEEDSAVPAGAGSPAQSASAWNWDQVGKP